MRIQLPSPRLLPLTIVAMAALLGVKSLALVRAAVPPVSPAAASAAPKAVAAKSEPDGKSAPQGPAEKADTSANAAKAGAKAAAPEVIAPPAPPISDSERTLLLDLRNRRTELDRQASALAAREAAAGAAEKRLAARVDELNALQKRLETLDSTRRSHDEANWQGLVKLYENMRPRDAATIFNDLDLPVLLPVLDRMKEAKAAAVLAAMQPERARLVTAELAQMRTHAVTPAPN